MKRKLLFFILIVMGFVGYWLSLNTWIFKSDSDISQYRSHLIEVGQWEQVNLSPSFKAVFEKIIKYPLNTINSIRSGYGKIDKTLKYEFITFQGDESFFREGGMIPNGKGSWSLNQDILTTKDDDFRDVMGGVGWFDKRKKIIKLTDKHLILYYDGYYYEYKPNLN